MAVLAAAGTARASEAPKNIDEAISEAKRAGKPLFVEVGATWCRPCKMFEQDVLPRPEVQAELAGVVFVHYDSDVEPGTAVAARYNVQSFPTFLALDGAGAVRGRIAGAESGAEGAASFIRFIKDSRQLVTEETQILADLARGPDDAGTQLAAARWYRARNRVAEALTHFDKVLHIAAASPDAQAEAAIGAAQLRRITEWRRQLVAEQVDLVRRFPKMPKVTEALALATIDSGLSPKDIEALFQPVIAATSAPGDLNALLYVALAAGARDAALAGADKLAALAPKNSDALDTVAEVFHARGAREAALRIEDEALKLGKGTPSEGALAANRERFASTSEESSEVKRERAKVAATWKRLEALGGGREPESEAPSDMPADFAQMQAFSQVTHGLAVKVGKGCAASAGKIEMAYVRLHLAADAGQPPSKVEVLEPSASPALRKCLARGFAEVKLPRPPALFRGKTVFPIPLGE